MHMQAKLENPTRVNELRPNETLQGLGIHDGDTVCDIGTGTGIFAIAAAMLTSGTVYAVDVNAELLNIVVRKAQDAGLANVHPMLVTSFDYPIKSNSVDLALLVTVLHEIDDKAALLAEISRILSPSGKLTIIDFKKDATMGPPPSLRISADEIEAICTLEKLTLTDQFLLGDNYYCLTFLPKSAFELSQFSL